MTPDTIIKTTTKTITGSEALLESLIQENTEIIFGYPGGAIMPVYDSLMNHTDKIRHLLTRHEQGAVHAAQGYARVTGKTGVCMATSGPGATNLITGLADAMMDSTPIVAITGQVISPLLGTDAFQETDVIGISMPVTKWNFLITKAEDIPSVIAKAFYIARTGRPGPVLIDIAKDAQFGKLDFEYKKCSYIRGYLPWPKVNEKAVKQAADLINKAEKPYILFGQGVTLAGAEEEFKQFIEKSGIPAAWTILGVSALPTGHPQNMGMLGMHGNYATNIMTNECDVLIAIGMRFDDRVTGNLDKYARQAKIIHMEIDPAEIYKNIKPDIAVTGNVKKTLPLLTRHVQERKFDGWIAEFKELDKKEHYEVISQDLYPKKPGLTMGEVIRLMNEKTKGEAIIVTDVGQHQMFASRYIKLNHPRSFVTSGGLGTMGFGVPTAMGAQVGKPDRQVIAIVGDGGLQMTIQELGTIKQSEIPVKILLLNNNYLGMVRQWQEMFFDKRYSQTYLMNPDFIKVAEGFGIKGRKVLERPELKEAIEEMLDYKGSYLLDVSIEKEDNVFPMVPAGAGVSEIILGKENK